MTVVFHHRLSFPAVNAINNLSFSPCTTGSYISWCYTPVYSCWRLHNSEHWRLHNVFTTWSTDLSLPSEPIRSSSCWCLSPNGSGWVARTGRHIRMSVQHFPTNIAHLYSQERKKNTCPHCPILNVCNQDFQYWSDHFYKTASEL